MFLFFTQLLSAFIYFFCFVSYQPAKSKDTTSTPREQQQPELLHGIFGITGGPMGLIFHLSLLSSGGRQRSMNHLSLQNLLRHLQLMLSHTLNKQITLLYSILTISKLISHSVICYIFDLDIIFVIPYLHLFYFLFKFRIFNYILIFYSYPVLYFRLNVVFLFVSI